MRRRTFVVFAALATALAMLPAGAAPGGDPGPKPGTPAFDRIATASDPAMAKIHPNLMADIQSAGAGKSLLFVARIMAGTDLSSYASGWFARPFVDPLGSTVASGFANGTQLLKMATLPGVISLQRAESIAEVPIVADPDLDAALNSNITPAINSDSSASPGPAPEGWYHTGSAIHGSQDAWAKGYTGEGVRYMSNDSGADYCHPDLEGTWAYIDDPSSPYYGLPEMFDSWSSFMAAFDYYLGASQIASGQADYADTSATAGGDFTYQPLGASVAHDYTVPVTSLSGVYHYGSHPDKALADVADILGGVFGDSTAARGERAAILVVDENTAGVYDTVYVDINYDFDFTNDAPARLGDFSGQENACLDYDFDGLNDVSGGLVYFISDGVTAVPTLNWLWGIPGFFFGNGDLVAFHVQDFIEPGGTHGQGTTSVAVGQGVVAGSVNWGPGGSPIAGFQGLVVGPGKDVASTQNGNFYISPFVEDAYIYSGLGYDGTPGTGDDIQIVSNSWGSSGIDNDGFDFESRLIDSINRRLAPNTALLFSTGNGAAGYGTNSPPSPASGIGVGASTLYGSIGIFEAIASEDQILGGDPMSWSNRGPGARNVTGADVVATGAFGTGDLSLNQVLWGAVATESFGGTSMAAPVAAGNLALMYQAWHERTGAWPTFEQARGLLMGTARDTNHDVWTQGSGLVDADVGTDAAAGAGALYALPSAWSAGSYRGVDYEAFAHILQPGGSDSESFRLYNHGSGAVKAKVSTTTFKLIETHDYSFTSLDQSMDHGSFTTPDYVFEVTDIPLDTDLLQVRVAQPYDQFNPTGTLAGPSTQYNNWRVHLQNWTDLNADGQFWVDTNGNGKVDLGGEMQTGEHIRFTYGYNVGPNQQARIANPLERVDDGLLLTFRHRNRTAAVPTTDLTVEASFWQKTNWSWLKAPKSVTVPAGGSKVLTASIKVPPKTPYGMYEGAIEVEYGGETLVIPVTVSVAASGTSFQFGTTNFANGRRALFDNELLFGYTDYSWRAESGDWRFFWTDIDEESLPISGTNFLVVDNAWANEGTDIDTIIQGPTADGFSPSELYGPYTLEEVGRSAYTYVGSGRWAYQTSSGGPREIVSAPLEGGLYAIQLHQVMVDGSFLDDPFQATTGLANLNPANVAGDPAGTADILISSELELTGFVAEGFGLSAPIVADYVAQQDDPNDPSSASVKVPVTMEHAGVARFETALSGDDLDLFLVYDFNDDGVFTNGEIIAASTTPTSDEFIEISFPADGDYEVWVQGWSVSGNPTFQLTVDVVQGFDIIVDSTPAAIAAGGSGTVSISWDISANPAGTYKGVLLFGPADAPGLFLVPLEVVVP